ncbi:MAG TPA: NAD(P)H-binding protein [Jiangellaceae bacterium]
MRIAVAGGTGLIGRAVVARLQELGHQPVIFSRRHGIDLTSTPTDDLAALLDDVPAVVDVTNTSTADPESARRFFGTVTRRLVTAGRQAGVQRHVLLSILGIDRVTGNAHYAGKRLQEELVIELAKDAVVVRAAPFHEFAAMVVGWTRQAGTAIVPPLLLQPVDITDVANELVDAATTETAPGRIDLAGPRPEDLVDMARRTLRARGENLDLVPSWQGPLGPDMAGEVLLPGPDARLGTVTFDQWLASQVAVGKKADR